VFIGLHLCRIFFDPYRPCQSSGLPEEVLDFPAGLNRAQTTENGESIESSAGVKFVRDETSGAVYQAGAGAYAFSFHQ
jgi:hypothetical protein